MGFQARYASRYSPPKIRHRRRFTDAPITFSPRDRIFAESVFAGTFDATLIRTGTLYGNLIKAGSVLAAYIGPLPANKTTTGTFGAVRIPNISASKIISGTFIGGDFIVGSPGVIKSSDYSPGTAGFKLHPTAGLEVNVGEIKGKTIRNSLSLAGFINYGGDGSDGDVTISTNTDISNSVKQYNNLTIDVGVTLTAKNCIIGVKETLTVNGNIVANGGGFTGGAGITASSADGNPGSSAPSGEQAFSGGAGAGGGGATDGGYNGGAGGAAGGTSGAAGVAADGNGGDGGAPTAAKQDFHKEAIRSLVCFSKGAGGGSGGINAGSGTSGAGGVGGGFLLIECTTFVGNTGSVISADGLVGDNADTYGGGGGGGGGGTLLTRCKTNSADSGTRRANGGTGGTGASGAGDGGDGGAGTSTLETIT